MIVYAACHIHSEWSYDGKWTLDELSREFSGRGYRVLMVTDHDRGFTERRHLQHRAACAAASTDTFLVLPGIEYSDADNRVHILVWGAVPFAGESIETSELLRAVSANNGIAVLAHPARREAWRSFDPEWTRCLHGIEIWNRKTDGWAPSTAASSLVDQTSLVPFVGMDFHTRKQLFPLGMSLNIEALNENAVLECLRMRDCSALAWGQPVASVTRGWRGSLLRYGERWRRKAAYLYRKTAKC